MLEVDIVSPANYEVGILQLPPDTTPSYIDRSYWFSDAPPNYVGLPFIRTANADRNNRSEEFLRFQVNKPVIIYVLYSAAAISVPDWVSSTFTATGEQISRTYHTWNIWRAEFPPGEIVLGGNMAPGVVSDGSVVGMYVPVIEGITGPVAPLSDFTASAVSGDAPLEVTFSDESAGDITGWSWDFDDNGTADSSERNPVHTYVDPGTYSVTLEVSGPAGSDSLTRTDYITVSEPPVNEPPAITSAAVTDAVQEQLYSYDVAATDPNAGDILTFSLDAAPAGMSIDPASGLIQWTPAIAQLGDHNVTVRVTDDGGLFDTQSFMVAVTEPPHNEPPVIISAPVTAATENLLYSYDADASDPNAGDILTFSLDAAPSGMTIDGTSGLIEWTPAGTQLGDHNVTVRVTDAAGLFDTQAFVIAVEESGELTVDIVSPANYEVGILQLPPDTTPSYIDRSYWFSDAPANYVGLPFIRTANADRNNRSEEFLRFQVNKPVRVYVCYSTAALSGPDWLESNFVMTADQISRTYHTWNVWEAEYPAGEVVLGGNMAPGAVSNGSVVGMYVVIIQEQ